MSMRVMHDFEEETSYGNQEERHLINNTFRNQFLMFSIKPALKILHSNAILKINKLAALPLYRLIYYIDHLYKNILKYTPTFKTNFTDSLFNSSTL